MRGIVIFLVFIVFLLSSLTSYQFVEAREAHAALCSLRNDIAARSERSIEFLEDHPNGIPGISAADIRRGITQQKSTLAALDALDC